MLKTHEKLHTITARAVDTFADCGIIVTVVGARVPSFIFDYKKVLNCYMKGNKLHFTVAREVQFKIKLSKKFKITPEIAAKIKEWFEASDHRECYRIKKVGEDSYLCCATYENSVKTLHFTKDCCKLNVPENGTVYFSKKFAQKIVNKASKNGMNIEVV